MSFDARLSVIGKYKGYDYEEITVSNAGAGIGFTKSKLETEKPPKRIYVTVETAQCRFKYNGAAPTITAGHPLNPFDQIYIEGIPNMKNFLAIRTGDNDSKLKCTYER